MRGLAMTAVAAALAAGAASAEALSADAKARIDALMVEMKCQINGEIEVEDGGYEIDDVFCADGKQYDVMLNAAFEVVEKREE